MKILLEIPDEQLTELHNYAIAHEGRLLWEGWHLDSVIINLLSRAAEADKMIGVPATAEISARLNGDLSTLQHNETIWAGKVRR